MGTCAFIRVQIELNVDMCHIMRVTAYILQDGQIGYGCLLLRSLQKPTVAVQMKFFEDAGELFDIVCNCQLFN